MRLKIYGCKTTLTGPRYVVHTAIKIPKYKWRFEPSN